MLLVRDGNSAGGGQIRGQTFDHWSVLGQNITFLQSTLGGLWQHSQLINSICVSIDMCEICTSLWPWKLGVVGSETVIQASHRKEPKSQKLFMAVRRETLAIDRQQLAVLGSSKNEGKTWIMLSCSYFSYYVSLEKLNYSKECPSCLDSREIDTTVEAWSGRNPSCRKLLHHDAEPHSVQTWESCGGLKASCCS